MAKNKLADLRNHLFAQLERLEDDKDMENDKNLQRELSRAKAIASVSQVIVNSAKLELEAIKLAGKGPANQAKPQFFELDSKKP